MVEFHEWLDFFKTLGKNTKKYEELPEFLKTYLHLFFLCSDANSTYHLFRAIICPFTTLGSILSSQFNLSSFPPVDIICWPFFAFSPLFASLSVQRRTATAAVDKFDFHSLLANSSHVNVPCILEHSLASAAAALPLQLIVIICCCCSIFSHSVYR